MFCENCGNKLVDGSKFCGSCGSKTEQEQTSYQVPPQEVAQTPPKTYHNQPSQSSQPPRAATYAGYGTPPLGVGQYIGMFLLLCIPLVNLVLLFMWGFGSNVNLNKKNFARASLILGAIMLIFGVVVGGAFVSSLGSTLSGVGLRY